jgi:uncharacterized membrane protein YfcA
MQVRAANAAIGHIHAQLVCTQRGQFGVFYAQVLGREVQLVRQRVKAGDAPKMELMMNIALLFLALFLMFNFEKPLEQSNKNLYVGGTISGFLAGLLGTGGAIRGITLAAFHLPKNVFIATSAVIDLGVDSSRAIVYLYNGYFDKKYIILIPFLILISVLGSAVGKWILERTSEKAFRYLVLLLIMATSVLQSIHFFSA